MIETMRLAKIEQYSDDYMSLPGLIRIRVDGLSDPLISSILSDIRDSDFIYLDMHYYEMVDFSIVIDDSEKMLELEVINVIFERGSM